MMLIRVPASIRRQLRERAIWAAKESDAATHKKEHDRVILPWFLETFRARDQDNERTIMVSFEDGTVVRSTLVLPASTVLDEEALRAAIGDKQYLGLCSTVVQLDQDKLAQAIATGRIDKGVVDACTIEKEGTPYIKHTVKTVGTE